MPRANRATCSRSAARLAAESDRIVPFIAALSGMTLCALPASIFAIVTTTGSCALKRRVTMVWIAVTISQATGSGSAASCGIEAWPLPLHHNVDLVGRRHQRPGAPRHLPVRRIGHHMQRKGGIGRARSARRPA
jgi:hypothetical protein